MKQTKISISGMHCKSCELLLSKELSKLKGVKDVDIHYKTGHATIHSSQDINQEEVEKVIEQCGYTIGEQTSHQWFTSSKNEYTYLGIAVLIAMIFLLVFQLMGGIHIQFNPSGNIGYLTIILVGLAAGFSTCMALIGGLVLGIAARHSELHPEYSGWKKFQPHLTFNAGRIIGFGLLGGLIGSLGSLFSLSNTTLAILTILIGIVLLFLGIKLLDISPRLNSFSFHLPSGIGKALGFHSEKAEQRTAFFSGMLTFFLPCGFTQAMQLYAMTSGSFLSGSIIMSLFALGTIPGLLGVGGLASIFKGITGKIFFKTAGIIVILLSFFNIQNGWAVLDLHLQSSAHTLAVTTPSSQKNDDVQLIEMSVIARGYAPNEFTVRKDKPVKWLITPKEKYTCANAFIVPQLNIQRQLVFGKTEEIEFTPTRTGDIRFSCSMGMYRGVIHVVDQGDTTSSSVVPSARADFSDSSDDEIPHSCNIANSEACGGNCGGGCGGCGSSR